MSEKKNTSEQKAETARLEKEQADRIEALKLGTANLTPMPIQPTLLDAPASTELAISGDMVTIENSLGVRHTVSATVAKVLAGEKTIKVVK